MNIQRSIAGGGGRGAKDGSWQTGRRANQNCHLIPEIYINSERSDKCLTGSDGSGINSPVTTDREDFNLEVGRALPVINVNLSKEQRPLLASFVSIGHRRR